MFLFARIAQNTPFVKAELLYAGPPRGILISESGESVSESPTILGDNREMYQPAVVIRSPDRSSSDAWIARLRERVFAIGGVEAIYFAKDGSTIDLWVIIPSRDLAVVRKVAETQFAVMREFIAQNHDPLFAFDFHTVYRGSRDPSELVPLRAVPLPSL